jgi:hypothetical protein
LYSNLLFFFNLSDFREQIDTTFSPSACALQEYASHPMIFGALLHKRGMEDALRDKCYVEV